MDCPKSPLVVVDADQLRDPIFFQQLPGQLAPHGAAATRHQHAFIFEKFIHFSCNPRLMSKTAKSLGQTKHLVTFGQLVAKYEAPHLDKV